MRCSAFQVLCLTEPSYFVARKSKPLVVIGSLGLSRREVPSSVGCARKLGFSKCSVHTVC